MKRGGFTALMHMMAAATGNFDQGRIIAKEITGEESNSSKLCFRKGCTNNRTWNKLYCSAECAKLDKERK